MEFIQFTILADFDIIIERNYNGLDGAIFEFADDLFAQYGVM